MRPNVLVGLIHFGYEPVGEKEFDVFVNVHYYLRWIYDNQNILKLEEEMRILDINNNPGLI